jgi:hypothetical protein
LRKTPIFSAEKCRKSPKIVIITSTPGPKRCANKKSTACPGNQALADDSDELTITVTYGPPASANGAKTATRNGFLRVSPFMPEVFDFFYYVCGQN